MCGKKWLCALLALVLVLSVMPGQIIGAAVEEAGVTAIGYQESELTRQESGDVVDVGPTLAEGNHVRWIDRIANLPDYAAEFYTWLEDNATATGALADPTRGQLVSGRYAYLLDTVSGTAEFTYTSSDDKLELARQASLEAIGDLHQIMMDYAFAVYGAFDHDHPEVFWLSGSSLCGYGISYGYRTSGGVGIANYELRVYFYLQTPDFDLRAVKYQDKAAIAAAIEERDSNIQRILADCPTDTTAVEQIKYLNDVLTETNAYNSAVAAGNMYAAAADAWQCVSALSGSAGVGGPVCEGYSRAFKVLCDELGIPCVLVEGDAKSTATSQSGAHMWNYVQLGNSWYAVDVTWNDPVVIGRESEVVSGYESDKWLFLGSSTVVNTNLTFLQSHPVTNNINTGGLDYVNGPVLAEDVYVQPENLLDISEYRSGDAYTAPEKAGRLFAGWYTDESLTQPLSADATKGYAYAKFVDENVLAVKYQITNGTTADSIRTNLRLLTGVDSLDYSSVSFTVTIGGVTQTVSSSRVYEQIKAGTTVTTEASSVFGEEARYFMTYTLLNVPQAMYDTDVTVTASWETPDGTVVTGTPRTFRISQGF